MRRERDNEELMELVNNIGSSSSLLDDIEELESVEDALETFTRN